MTSQEFAKSLFFALSDADIRNADMRHDFSKQVIKKRLSLGLTRKEFAEKFKISQSMAAKLENSSNNYTVKTLSSVAEKLGVSLAM